jgi:hypothetical protein
MKAETPTRRATTDLENLMILRNLIDLTLAGPDEDVPLNHARAVAKALEVGLRATGMHVTVQPRRTLRVHRDNGHAAKEYEEGKVADVTINFMSRWDGESLVVSQHRQQEQ